MFKKKQPAPQAPKPTSDMQVRNAALKHAVEAHRGRMPQDIAAAAEVYYNFLKGNTSNAGQ